MRKIIYLLVVIVVSACAKRPLGELSKMVLCLEPVNKQSVLQSPEYFTWGGSPVKGTDGKYHLYYSRWKKEYGFLAWVTHSEIAHAVAESADGPYVFSDVTLPARGSEYWDGLTTHNPTIHYYEGKYYLYYMGTTGGGEYRKDQLNVIHRNNQRIGVAVSTSPYGPWKRFDKPLIDVSSDSLAHDALMVSNPSILQRPDGTYLMVYKAVGKKKAGIWGGPVVHLCATSDSPMGPFKKYPNPIFTSAESSFPAEDPYIWYQNGGYYAIVKDMHGSFTKAGRSLALFYSVDGLDWKAVDKPLVSMPEIHWKDGSIMKLQHLERPQLLIEDGKPTMLFLAADTLAKELGKYAENGHSFNVHIRLK